MAYFEKDGVKMVSETRDDEIMDSNFRKLVSRKQISASSSSSISIPIASLESYEENSHGVYDTQGPIIETGNIDYDGKNKHLLRSGKLGLCNYHYCTTCPTYLKPSQPRTRTSSTLFDHKFQNNLFGDDKDFGRKPFSFSSYVPGVMNPHAKVVQQWNKIFVIFYLVEIFVDPLFFFLIYVKKDDKCIAINWTFTRTLVVYRSINDLVYFFYILLQFRLAYVAPESRDLVDDPEKIAIKYLKGYFLIDLFVVFPFPQTLMLVLKKYLRSSGANYGKRLGVVICVQYLFRLSRFLQIERSTTGFILEPAWAKDIKNLLIFMLSGHLVGSCWYLFGLQRVNECFQNACHNSNITGCLKFIGCSSSSKNSDLWTNNVMAIACLNSTSSSDFSYGIYEDAVPLTIETRMFNKYVYALFWGFQQVISLADNLKPTYNLVLEVGFSMAIMALGLCFFALLIGNIQSFLQTLRQRRLEMELRGRDVEQWMNHRRIPEDLRRRIRMAELYNWASTKGVNEEMLLENLQEDLQRDIRRHLFKFVKKVRILALMDEPILDAICERLKKKAYIKRSRILSQGAIVEKMMFVVRGKLESIGADGTKLPLSDGDVCGEELLTWYLEHAFVSTDGEKVRLRGPRLISNRTVRCLTNVEAFSLRLADLEDITILFPEFLQNPRVQGAIRYASPYWRSLAAKCIQVAWRYKKRQSPRL